MLLKKILSRNVRKNFLGNILVLTSSNHSSVMQDIAITDIAFHLTKSAVDKFALEERQLREATSNKWFLT